MGEGASIG